MEKKKTEGQKLYEAGKLDGLNLAFRTIRKLMVEVILETSVDPDAPKQKKKKKGNYPLTTSKVNGSNL